MSRTKELKVYFILFILMMGGFALTAPAMFRWYFQNFNENIHRKISLHIEVMRDINDIETALYVYQKSFTCYLQTKKEDCLINVKEARQKVMDRFTYLEDYNSSEFASSWIEVTEFETNDVEDKLRQTLSESNLGQTTINISDFQKLFYLVRTYTKTYFMDSVRRLKTNLVAAEIATSAAENGGADLSVESEQNRVDLLFLGITKLKDNYHNYFWNFSYNQNSRFKTLTDQYLIVIIAGFTITLLFAALLATRAFKLFALEKQSKKEILALGTRDKVTGLFNYSSLKILLSQEVARSMRTERPISLILIRIDSYDEVEKNGGLGAAEQLIFQISETLKRFCRAYDRLYKYNANTFLIVFPETTPKALGKLAARFQSKITGKRFVVQKSKNKFSPAIQIGAACFPVNGKTTEELLKTCESSLSKNFTTNQIFSADVLGKTDLFETDRSKPLEEPPAAKMAEPENTPPEEPAVAVAPESPEPAETPLPEPAHPETKDALPEALTPTPPQEETEDLPDVVAALSQDENTTDIQVTQNNNESVITVDMDHR